MLSDMIIEEIRHVRETHAAQFDYDLDAIYADIKQREKDSQRHYVTLAPKHYVTVLKTSKVSGEA